MTRNGHRQPLINEQRWANFSTLSAPRGACLKEGSLFSRHEPTYICVRACVRACLCVCLGRQHFGNVFFVYFILIIFNLHCVIKRLLLIHLIHWFSMKWCVTWAPTTHTDIITALVGPLCPNCNIGAVIWKWGWGVAMKVLVLSMHDEAANYRTL